MLTVEQHKSRLSSAARNTIAGGAETSDTALMVPSRTESPAGWDETDTSKGLRRCW
jgi:hypothetical protein